MIFAVDAHVTKHLRAPWLLLVLISIMGCSTFVSGAAGREVGRGSVKGDGGMALHLSAGTGWLALTQFCINIVHQKAGE